MADGKLRMTDRPIRSPPSHLHRRLTAPFADHWLRSDQSHWQHPPAPPEKLHRRSAESTESFSIGSIRHPPVLCCPGAT